MKALIRNNKIEKYPVSANDIKKLFPQVSIPKDIKRFDYNGYKVVDVLPSQQPKENGFNATQSDPELINDQWIQSWKLTKTQKAITKAPVELKEMDTKIIITDTADGLIIKQLFKDPERKEWTKNPEMDLDHRELSRLGNILRMADHDSRRSGATRSRERIRRIKK